MSLRSAPGPTGHIPDALSVGTVLHVPLGPYPFHPCVPLPSTEPRPQGGRPTESPTTPEVFRPAPPKDPGGSCPTGVGERGPPPPQGNPWRGPRKRRISQATRATRARVTVGPFAKPFASSRKLPELKCKGRPSLDEGEILQNSHFFLFYFILVVTRGTLLSTFPPTCLFSLEDRVPCVSWRDECRHGTKDQKRRSPCIDSTST